MNADIKKQLQSPFPPDAIEWRVGSTTKDKSKGLALAYITNRAIMDRLDEIFGIFGWKNEYREWKSESQICGISVWDADKKEWVTKWDGADNSNMEPTKGGLSDAMKRAAYQWGIGRYLYKMPAVWVPLKDGKYLAKTPDIPTWALPEGCKPNEGSKQSAPQENGDKAADKMPKKAPNKAKGKPNAPEPISKQQMRRISQLMKERAINSDEVKIISLTKFDKESSKALTKKEGNQLIVELENFAPETPKTRVPSSGSKDVESTDFTGTPFEDKG